ncbi:MAG: Uncharacterised protein [Halieaceae bacterium]|nr:MAG: Uncharacterised protein [Halieaceae bacterium]
MWRSTLCLHSADTRRSGGSRGKAISVTERRTAFRATVLFYSAIFQSSIVKGYVVQGYVVQGSIAQALG